MERSYSPKEAAAILGVTVHTVQVWDRSGRMSCIRLPSGRRRVAESELRRLLNMKEERREAIYARVSSYDQQEDLERQVAILKELTPPSALVYTDVRSGLNFTRKGLTGLLEDVTNRKVSKIYVTYEDRLARFGFDLLSWLCGRFGTEIVVVNRSERVTPQEELVKDLISIITSFSARLYGLRSHKAKKLLGSVKEVVLS